jgi:hypothetical protein
MELKRKEVFMSKGEKKPYKPLVECIGFWDWYEVNQGHWKVSLFEYVVSIIVSVITSLITVNICLR